MAFLEMERTIRSSKGVDQIVRMLRTSDCLPFVKPFHGTVKEDSFDLEPVHHYRDLTAPRLRGQLVQSRDGTEVQVRAEPVKRQFLIVIMALVVVVMVAIFLRDLAPALDGDLSGNDLLQVAVPLPMGALMVGIFQFSFWLSAKNALDRLEKMLR